MMKMMIQLQSLSSTVIGLLLLTTNSLAVPPDTLYYFPDHRVEGNASAFYKFLSQSLRYPYPARQDGTVGTAIVSLTLHPAGSITVATFNPISPSVDEELLTKFKNTEQLWLADSLEEKSFIMFFPVTFLIGDFRFARSQHILGFMQEEITVTTHPSGGSRISAPDHKIAEKAITFYYEKKYKKALRFLDALIRRNPFHEGLYKMRAHSRYILGNRPGACEDYHKIKILLHQPVPETAKNLCQ